VGKTGAVVVVVPLLVQLLGALLVLVVPVLNHRVNCKQTQKTWMNLKLVTKQMSREKRKSFQSQSVLRCSSSERKAVKKGKREQRMSLQLKRRQQIKIKQAFKRFRFLSCASLFFRSFHPGQKRHRNPPALCVFLTFFVLLLRVTMTYERDPEERGKRSSIQKDEYDFPRISTNSINTQGVE
jgi:hypothetical protein